MVAQLVCLAFPSYVLMNCESNQSEGIVVTPGTLLFKQQAHCVARILVSVALCAAVYVSSVCLCIVRIICRYVLYCLYNNIIIMYVRMYVYVCSVRVCVLCVCMYICSVLSVYVRMYIRMWCIVCMHMCIVYSIPVVYVDCAHSTAHVRIAVCVCVLCIAYL